MVEARSVSSCCKFLLDRRGFLRGAAGATAGVGAASLGLRCARPGFFSEAEFATLEALCDRLLPPDQDPGAMALGVLRYIEGLLTALDGRRPRIFAGGPIAAEIPSRTTSTKRTAQ